MARKVQGYFLATDTSVQEIKVPPGAELVSVGVAPETGRLILWATVDASRPATAVRTIAVLHTNEPLPDGILRFIGTVRQANGSVFHVFEG